MRALRLRMGDEAFFAALRQYLAEGQGEVMSGERLLEIMARLRDPQTGCPWDIKQSSQSISAYTGAEPQKAGVMPEQADAFVEECRSVHGLDVEGLMAIPPADEDVALHAAFLGKIAARNGLAKLSIGMSDDFATAIRFGATHVRVGSAIFGPRPPRPATP